VFYASISRIRQSCRDLQRARAGRQTLGRPLNQENGPQNARNDTKGIADSGVECQSASGPDEVELPTTDNRQWLAVGRNRLIRLVLHDPHLVLKHFLDAVLGDENVADRDPQPVRGIGT
jgi:hypothetical protein